MTTLRVWVEAVVSGTVPSLSTISSGMPSKTRRVEAVDWPGTRTRSVVVRAPERTVTGTSAIASPSLRTSTAMSQLAALLPCAGSSRGVTFAMLRSARPRSL